MRRRTVRPPVTGVLTTSGRRHWASRSRHDLAPPRSSGGAVTFLLLAMVVGVAVVLALTAFSQS